MSATFTFRRVEVSPVEWVGLFLAHLESERKQAHQNCSKRAGERQQDNVTSKAVCHHQGVFPGGVAAPRALSGRGGTDIQAGVCAGVCVCMRACAHMCVPTASGDVFSGPAGSELSSTGFSGGLSLC